MEEQTKNRYLLGILGALLGALIGSIPWILSYVFANMIYAVLSIVIVICAFYGYKLTKAKMDKKLPVILSIVSFIAITITMLVAIPLIYMSKEGVPITLETFKTIYSIEEVSNVIIADYVISLLFCAVVIGSIVYNLNKQIKHGVSEKNIKILTQSVENDRFSDEDIEKARDVFEKNDALSKNHTITKELIVEDLQREFGNEKGSQIFEYLKIEGVIKKKANKYYFSEKAQNSPYYRYGFANLKLFLIILIIAISIAGLMWLSKKYTKEENNNQNNTELGEIVSSYNIENTDLTLEFDEDMAILSDEQITYYFGQGYAEIYECVAVSSDFEKMIMVLQNSKENFKDNYTAKQFLEDVAKESGDKKPEVIKKEISGHEFYVLEREYTSNNDIVYLEQDYVYDSGDKFVCIIFDNIKSDAMNPEKIIK